MVKHIIQNVLEHQVIMNENSSSQHSCLELLTSKLISSSLSTNAPQVTTQSQLLWETFCHCRTLNDTYNILLGDFVKCPATVVMASLKSGNL